LKIATSVKHLRNGVLTCFGKGRKERAIPFGRSAALAIENYIAAKPFALKTPNSPESHVLGLFSGG
jgi:site-specific recombinase XerD